MQSFVFFLFLTLNIVTSTKLSIDWAKINFKSAAQLRSFSLFKNEVSINKKKEISEKSGMRLVFKYFIFILLKGLHHHFCLGSSKE